MKLKLEKPIVFIDFETTGTNPHKDRIVYMGFKKVMQDQSVFETLEQRINPTIPIPPKSTAVHGITDDMVKDCPTFLDVSAGVVDFIAGCDIGGYNVIAYDAVLLNEELFRSGIEWDYSEVKFIDPLAIARKRESRNLEWAMKFYCGKEHVDHHKALPDAAAAMEVFMAQLERYDDLPEGIDGLAQYCNDGKQMLDLSGKFKIDDQGVIVFNFGEHKDEPATNHFDYLRWMLNRDFPPDTVRIIKKIFKGK